MSDEKNNFLLSFIDACIYSSCTTKTNTQTGANTCSTKTTTAGQMVWHICRA